MDHHPDHRSRTTASVATRAGSGAAGLVLVPGTVCLAMIAGMFFDWAVSIMPALAGTDDRTYVVFMQATIATINTSPLFLVALTGAFLLLAVSVVLLLRRRNRAGAGWTSAALGGYIVAIVITGVVHVPLNDALQVAGDPDAIADLAGLRASTEAAWVGGHVVRTVAAVLALVCACRALLLAAPAPRRS